MFCFKDGTDTASDKLGIYEDGTYTIIYNPATDEVWEQHKKIWERWKKEQRKIKTLEGIICAKQKHSRGSLKPSISTKNSKKYYREPRLSTNYLNKLGGNICEL